MGGRPPPLPWRGMIELFQITGSASFAARAALEEAGAEYVTVEVHPRNRDEPPEFAAVNPLRRVPAVREGRVIVYETGAVLQYVAERFPGAHLAPPLAAPARGAYLRWMTWLANTLHGIWQPLTAPKYVTNDAHCYEGIRHKGIEKLEAAGAYLEQELTGATWCVGDAFSVADIYLYMLKGWESYAEGYSLGGEAVAAHYERVGARPAIARTRSLDDLDETFQRHHPDLRAGKPF
jgi:glutathione S-transferase